MKFVRLLCLAALALPACNRSQQAMGTTNSVIVLTTDSVWAMVGDSVLTALEPRIFTVRDERTFDVTQVSPQDPNWTDLRRFRQVLAIGTAEDGWVEPVLRRADDAVRDGGVARRQDVWARNQLVTAIVVPPGAGPDAVLRHVAVVAQSLDSTFRAGALQRMFLSRPDTLLRDSLRARHGFGILLPNVYRPLTREADVHLFQSSTQVGGTLVRSILVTQRDGLLPLTAETALAWRDSAGAAEYRPAHETPRDRIASQMLSVGGAPAVEVQGVWDGTDPTWPMSGPFLARMIHCEAQDRTWFVDAWVYAPGRAKYEYMIQLQTILNTFECV
jgi:hypothetical protein